MYLRIEDKPCPNSDIREDESLIDENEHRTSSSLFGKPSKVRALRNVSRNRRQAVPLGGSF